VPGVRRGAAGGVPTDRSGMPRLTARRRGGAVAAAEKSPARIPPSRLPRAPHSRGRVHVTAVQGGWAWTCPSERHAELRAGESFGGVVPSWAYRDAWSVALALGTQHEELYHADGRRLGLHLPLELVDADDGGSVHPPDPDAVYHLEVCS
jgi:hypothetical protein